MGSDLALEAVLAWLVFVNLATWRLFARDRTQTAAGIARIPERALLALAIFGGSPAAKLAQWWMRHKHRDSAFQATLTFVIIMQVMLGVSALSQTPQARAAMERLTPLLIDQIGLMPAPPPESGPEPEVAEAAPAEPQPRRFGPTDANATVGRFIRPETSAP